MNESTRVRLVRDLAEARTDIQQFGQADDSLWFDGATACGATVLQFLTLLWNKRFYTLNQIARAVGYPTAFQKANKRGIYQSQIQKWIYLQELPYKMVSNWTNVQIMRQSNLYGPSAVAYMYAANPEWYGYKYLGLIADGKPNGYASPLGKAGKTQLTGFEDGSHLGIELGYTVIRDASGNVLNRHHYFKDPNHGSILRPERPAYDTISDKQFANLVPSLKQKGITPFAFVPTVPYGG